MTSVESLFSLELAVEHMVINENIVCRFPAIAFRLLDFPTLMIHHVDEELSKIIHKKISLDSYFKLGNQMPELKNKQGQFHIKKGKSCLFKATKELLLEHFEHIPMYVMVLDAFPKVPKFIGSCMIPLHNLMKLIANDIKTQGITVPSTHGECGDFEIFNLMGVSAGKVSFGYRLLSLGVGLMQHIPDSSVYRVTQSKPTAVSMRDPTEPRVVQANTDIILEELEKPKNPEHIHLLPEKECMMTQTEGIQMFSELSQTQDNMLNEHKDRIYDEKINKTKKSKNAWTDVFLTNAVCPPPLFYNTALENTRSLTFQDGELPEYINNPNHKIYDNTSHDSDNESDSTIRHEDVYTEDVFVDFNSSLIIPKTKPSKTIIFPEAKKKKKSPDLSQLPILNALMQEIAKLQSGNIPPISEVVPVNPDVTDTPEIIPVQNRQSSKIVATRETRDQFLARLSSSKKAAPGLVKTRTKQKEPEIRTHKIVPESPSRKSQLMSGMTTTQRLRLAKTNPEILPELELQEEKRIMNRKNSGFSSSRSLRTKHNIPPLSLEQNGGGSCIGTFDTQRTDLGTSRSERKRPVPTPRLTRTFNYQNQKNMEEQTKYIQNADIEAKPYQYPVQTDRTEEYSMSFDNVSDTYSTESVKGKTRIVQFPKYPPPISPRKLTSRSQTSISFDHYSDDKFDSETTHHDSLSNEGLVPELKQYVETYAHSNDDYSEELQLRRVVDHYSDDSEVEVVSVKSGQSNKTYQPQPRSSNMPSTSRFTQGGAQLTESNESTAYIPRSAIPSQSYDSLGGEPRSVSNRPKPSPRRIFERHESVNTESVSSYVPDGETSGEISQSDEDYSDDFENEYLSAQQTISKLKISPQAKLGYTIG